MDDLNSINKLYNDTFVHKFFAVPFGDSISRIYKYHTIFKGSIQISKINVVKMIIMQILVESSLLNYKQFILVLNELICRARRFYFYRVSYNKN